MPVSAGEVTQKNKDCHLEEDMMSSRTISTILCFSAICWNVKATVTPKTTKTLISTEYLPPNATIVTTFQPTSNSSDVSTSSNEINTTLNSQNTSLVTIPTTMLESQTTVTISGPSTVTFTTTSFPFVTVPETGQTGSTESKKFKTITTISTKEYSENYITVTYPMETDTTLLAGTKSYSLAYSETVLTSIFGTTLALVILTILAFTFKKYKRRRSQYSHHPLHESSYEPADRYTPPDDTLVISGGLYDAPRIYNPNMTVLEEEDSHTDYVTFNSSPGQFRLEFLPDNNMDPAINSSLRNV